MRRPCRSALFLPCCVLLFAAPAVRAEGPPDPLRLVPKEADFVLKVDRPRQAADAFTGLEAFRKLTDLPAVREYYDSTNFRRFTQLVAHFEREMGLPWPELLDKVAGGGAAVATKFGSSPAPVLVVAQGKDEAAVKKFFAAAVVVGEQELARQDSKERPVKEAHRGVEVVRVGKEFHAAAAGTALLVSNNAAAIRKAIDLHLDGDAASLAKVSSVAQARASLPADPLAWLWLNFEPVHKTPMAKEVFALPKNDTNLLVLFGGWLEVARRSPFLAAAAYREGSSFVTTVRMPSGREGMPDALAVHLPPADAVGSLPLLEPKGVLYSTSYYLDVSQFWDKRAKLFSEKQVKGLEEFDKNSAKFLLGNRFNRLLAQAGPHQRVVVTRPASTVYKKEPGTRFPGFAVVLEMRDPAFGKSLDGLLRAAGFLTSTQFKLKLVEEKDDDVNIIAYRFPEDGPGPKGDVTDVRFNFSPAFARVGNQFIAASTVELCRELVGLVRQEAREKKPGSPSSVVSKAYAAGGADYLRSVEDQLLTQTILDQAASPESARQQVQAFITWVRGLDGLMTEARYGPRDFRYDIRLNLGK